MELFLIISSALTGMSIVTALIVGVTRYDIISIKADRDFQRHPYAKRFRKRPTVSIVIDAEPSDACLKSIRRSNYRKTTIVKNVRSAKSLYILSITPDTVLERTTISQAVRRFNSDPTLPLVEIQPTLQPAQTLRQFFRNYQQIATTPFSYARAGLGMFTLQVSRPVIVSTHTQIHRYRSGIYSVVARLGRVANFLALVYLSYIALILMQPEFLLGYILGFSLWLLWAISGNRQLTLGRKIVYIMLFPTSFGYFAARCLLAPFWLSQYKPAISLLVSKFQPSNS